MLTKPHERNLSPKEPAISEEKHEEDEGSGHTTERCNMLEGGANNMLQEL